MAISKIKLLRYNPRDNNCQIFIMSCLKYNKLLTKELEDYKKYI